MVWGWFKCITFTVHFIILCCCSATKSCLTLCWPHGLQHARLPCPSPSPKVCPNSSPLHRWCHPAFSFPNALSSSYPQSFPASVTFLMSRLFTLGDQNTRASALASVLPMSIQGWFPLRLTGLILLSKGLSLVFSSTTIQRHHYFGTLPCTLEETPDGCHRDPLEVTVPQREKAVLDVESLKLTSAHSFFFLIILFF